MVGIGFLLAGLVLYYWFRSWRGRRLPMGKWLLRGLVASGPLAFMAIEFGWAVTELGRQPYIVYGYMLVKDGVTTARGLDVSFPTFFILYIILGIASVVFLLRLAREPRGSDSSREKPTHLESRRRDVALEAAADHAD